MNTASYPSDREQIREWLATVAPGPAPRGHIQYTCADIGCGRYTTADIILATPGAEIARLDSGEGFYRLAILLPAERNGDA